MTEDKPTDAMIEAGEKAAFLPLPTYRDLACAIYTAMQAARPPLSDDKRSILEQVKLDQEAFARLSPVQQQAAINELRSIGFNPGIEFGSSDDKLSGLVERCERLEERLVETQMLAFKWMEAHDNLAAGKPYKFPSPADAPDAIEALQQQLRMRDEALEQAESDLLNIADGCGYRYHHETILKAVSAALAKVRKALSTTEGSDR